MSVTKGSDPIITDVNNAITKFSGRRNPFSSSCINISRPTINKESSISNSRISTVRFALVSLNRPTGTIHNDDILSGPLSSTKSEFTFRNKRGLDNKACKRRLYLSTHRQGYQYLSIYKGAIQEALDKYKANIICINELGIPSDITGPLPAFFKDIKQLANRHSAVIITGSFHDSRTRYNTGYIFYPNCKEHCQAFHKQVSATRDIGEYISIPSERRTIVFRAFRHNIAVLTCLDLMDYSIISSLVQLGDKLDFLVVPACTPKIESLEEIAKMISDVMPGGVFIINEYSVGKQPFYSAYLFGKLQKSDHHTILDNNGVINVFEITRTSFRDEKDGKQDIDSDLKWLLVNPLADFA